MLRKYICTTSRSTIDIILVGKSKHTVNQFDQQDLKTLIHVIPSNKGQHY